MTGDQAQAHVYQAHGIAMSVYFEHSAREWFWLTLFSQSDCYMHLLRLGVQKPLAVRQAPIHAVSFAICPPSNNRLNLLIISTAITQCTPCNRIFRTPQERFTHYVERHGLTADSEQP